MIIKINEIEFGVEEKLLKKLDKMCERVTREHPRLDSCLENAGYEGTGKTNGSIIEAAYVRLKVNRPISLFFKTSSCLRFAQSTEKQIIILDEPSFESLSTDQTTLNKDFLRLISTMREKRHFFILNFAKFWKFPDWLVIDRALGMVYSYLRGGTEFRYVYIRQKKLQMLWDIHQKTKKKAYVKCKSFGGSFSYQMEKLWDGLDIRIEDTLHSKFSDYLKQRDMAIQSIGTIKSKVTNQLYIELRALKRKIANLDYKNIKTKQELAAYLGVTPRTFRDWGQNIANPLGNEVFEGGGGTILN